MTDDNLTNEIESEPNEIESIEDLKQTLVDEKQKAEDYLANWQRVQADFINYKRRSEQEKEEISRFANSTLILNLLPILDDFDIGVPDAELPTCVESRRCFYLNSPAIKS